MKPGSELWLARDKDGGAVLRETLREQIERALGDVDADVSVLEPMMANSSILQQCVHHRQTEADRGDS